MFTCFEFPLSKCKYKLFFGRNGSCESSLASFWDIPSSKYQIYTFRWKISEALRRDRGSEDGRSFPVTTCQLWNSLKAGLHYRKFLARLGWNWHRCQNSARQTLFTLHHFHRTKNTVPKFWACVSSLGDMRSSVIGKDGRRSLRAVSLKEDVSQSSKLKYGHQIWHKFAGKNALP